MKNLLPEEQSGASTGRNGVDVKLWRLDRHSGCRCFENVVECARKSKILNLVNAANFCKELKFVFFILVKFVFKTILGFLF